MADTSDSILGLPPQSAPPILGLAPITPDGKAADMSKVLFTTVFWLFLYNITQRVVSASGFQPGGGPPANGDVLTWVAANNDYEPEAPSVVPGAITIDSHTLTVATTNIVASVIPAPANGCLAVRLIQDATGGRLVTWDAGSFLYSPGAASTKANARAVYLFIADVVSGKWEPAAPPQVH